MDLNLIQLYVGISHSSLLFTLLKRECSLSPKFLIGMTHGKLSFQITIVTKKAIKPCIRGLSIFFGQCWTTKLESDAMWRIYSPSKSGVKITTNICQFDLLQNIRRLGVEKVVYFSHWKQLPELTNADKSPYLDVRYKRDAFSHEEEVRFIVHPDSVFDGDFWDNSHINLPISVDRFIQSIEIDPRAPVWVVDMIENYVKRVLPEVSLGKSNLYQKNTEFKLVKKWVPVEN